ACQRPGGHRAQRAGHEPPAIDPAHCHSPGALAPCNAGIVRLPRMLKKRAMLNALLRRTQQWPNGTEDPGMPQPAYQDLAAFVVVAREGSFTRAAAQLGVTPSALSHAIRGLEERVGLRLLNRTTRSVTTTEAGQRLRDQVEPHFQDIQSA